MDPADQTTGIGDDEVVYRRIPAKPEYINPALTPPIAPLAFRPNQNDMDGLSLTRAKYQSPEVVAASGSLEREYFVASLRVADIRGLGMQVIADPRPYNEGHCLIPELTYRERRSDLALERQRALAVNLSPSYEGPFPGKTPREA